MDRKQYDKEWRLNNKEKIREANKRYNEKNRDLISEKARDKRKENQEKNRLYRKEYDLKNKEQEHERKKEWRLNNKEYYSKYKKENREKINSRKRELEKEKRQNPHYRLICNLRTRVSKVIKENIKESSSLILLGCTLDELRQHLESKFQEGMTWENYGFRGWHVDHIIPCSKFDLSCFEQQKQCFHYMNLQPLWWRDNLSKGDR